MGFTSFDQIELKGAFTVSFVSKQRVSKEELFEQKIIIYIIYIYNTSQHRAMKILEKSFNRQRLILLWAGSRKDQDALRARFTNWTEK